MSFTLVRRSTVSVHCKVSFPKSRLQTSDCNLTPQITHLTTIAIFSDVACPVTHPVQFTRVICPQPPGLILLMALHISTHSNHPNVFFLILLRSKIPALTYSSFFTQNSTRRERFWESWQSWSLVHSFCKKCLREREKWWVKRGGWSGSGIQRSQEGRVSYLLKE